MPNGLSIEHFCDIINSESSKMAGSKLTVFMFVCIHFNVKSVQSALSDLLTTSATHGTFSRSSRKRGLISIIKLMQFTIVPFF